MNKYTSIRSAILFKLIIPMMMFIIIIESTFSYFVTLHNVKETYDRWLLDSARSLEQEIKVVDNKVSVQLSDSALKIFKWDDIDSTYFKIQAESKGVLVGDLPLRDTSPPLNGNTMMYSNILLNGEKLRMISLKASGDLPENVYIHVAETINKRRQRFFEIFFADITPQLLLTLFIGLLLYKGVNYGLAPLHKLADAIAKRSPTDLSPIPDADVFEEVRILTNTTNNLFATLADSIAAQQRFIANAAHQLRTPLAGLKLQAERAQREQNIETMRPALAQIQHSADRISHMINQLLVLARSGQNNGGHHFESLDLLDLSKTVCMEWVPQALEKDIAISFETQLDSLFVIGNQVLLTELLANLLDNAIKYGYQGGNITVSLMEQPSPCLIVEDDGPGIKETEYTTIFERFYRSPESTVKGCGLGLSIVKEIADLHQIEVKLEKSSKGGVRVELGLANLIAEPIRT